MPTRHDLLHPRIPTRVIPPSSVHRGLGDPKLFPPSLHYSVDFWCRRRYYHLLVYPSDQLFPFVFVPPLSLSAHTIGFFDSPNLYYRSYLAVSRHFTLPPSPPSSIVKCTTHAPPCVRAPLSLKRNDGEASHSDLHPSIFAVQ